MEIIVYQVLIVVSFFFFFLFMFLSGFCNGERIDVLIKFVVIWEN